jgi:integrase
MLTDFRKPLLRISLDAGFTEPVRKGGEVVKDRRGQPVLRSAVGFKTCRHTYCCARLATLDRGAPVSQDTVARELGHSSTDLVQEVYGHLGTVRHRSGVVEYRVEQHAEILGERLDALYRLAGVASGTVSRHNAYRSRQTWRAVSD